MADTMLSTEALQNAQRLLQSAEMVEPNLSLMEAYTRLAEIWVQVAGWLHESE